MDEVWKTITTPVFLVCTLAFGLLLNLVSHYFAKGLDKVLGVWSASRAQRLRDQSHQFDVDVKMLCQHPHLVQFFVAEENRLKWASALEVVIGFLLLLTTYGHLLVTSWTEFSPLTAGYLVGATIMTIWSFRRALRTAQSAYYHGQAVRLAFRLDRHRLKWNSNSTTSAP